MANDSASKIDLLNDHTRGEIDHWVARFPADRKRFPQAFTEADPDGVEGGRAVAGWDAAAVNRGYRPPSLPRRSAESTTRRS